jgi:HTH-like domain
MTERPMSEPAQASQAASNRLSPHRGHYGSPRLYVELHDQGIISSRKRVARLM